MNFQKSSVEQGELFAQTCLMALKLAGFDVVATKELTADLQIEIDAIANNRHGIAFPFEFKGSWQGKRPGMLRSDTVKKAIATAYLFSLDEMSRTMAPLVVLTSHKPAGKPASWLTRINPAILLDVLSLTDDRERLAKLADSTEEELKRSILGYELKIENLKRRNGYYDCLRQGTLEL